MALGDVTGRALCVPSPRVIIVAECEYRYVGIHLVRILRIIAQCQKKITCTYIDIHYTAHTHSYTCVCLTHTYTVMKVEARKNKKQKQILLVVGVTKIRLETFFNDLTVGRSFSSFGIGFHVVGPLTRIAFFF